MRWTATAGGWIESERGGKLMDVVISCVGQTFFFWLLYVAIKAAVRSGRKDDDE